MNLWWVDCYGDCWGMLVCLLDMVNVCLIMFVLSVVGDGSVYYIGCDFIDGMLCLLYVWVCDG